MKLVSSQRDPFGKGMPLAYQQKKSNHAKEQSGDTPSKPQKKTQDKSSNRNMSIDNAKE